MERSGRIASVSMATHGLHVTKESAGSQDLLSLSVISMMADGTQVGFQTYLIYMPSSNSSPNGFLSRTVCDKLPAVVHFATSLSNNLVVRQIAYQSQVHVVE